jgi:hypothetical protein
LSALKCVCISGTSRQPWGTVRAKCIGSPRQGQVTSRLVLIVSIHMLCPRGALHRDLADKLRLTLQRFLEFRRFAPAVSGLLFTFGAGVFRSLLAYSDASDIVVVFTHRIIPKIKAPGVCASPGASHSRPVHPNPSGQITAYDLRGMRRVKTLAARCGGCEFPRTFSSAGNVRFRGYSGHSFN